MNESTECDQGALKPKTLNESQSPPSTVSSTVSSNSSSTITAFDRIIDASDAALVDLEAQWRITNNNNDDALTIATIHHVPDSATDSATASAFDRITSAFEEPFKVADDSAHFFGLEDKDLIPTIDDFSLFCRFAIMENFNLLIRRSLPLRVFLKTFFHQPPPLRLVLGAISAHLVRPPVSEDVVFSYHRRAKKAVMKYAHIPSLKTAQAFYWIFSVSLWKGQPALGQPFFLRALEMAKELRLNIDPEDSPWLLHHHLTEFEKEERRRFFWVCDFLLRLTQSISEEACQIEFDQDQGLRPPSVIYDSDGIILFPPADSLFISCCTFRLIARIKLHYRQIPHSLSHLLGSPELDQLSFLSHSLCTSISAVNSLLVSESPSAITQSDYTLFLDQLSHLVAVDVVPINFNFYAAQCMLNRTKLYLTGIKSCHPAVISAVQRDIIATAVMHAFEGAHRVAGLLEFLNLVAKRGDTEKVPIASNATLVYALFEAGIVFWFLACRMDPVWWAVLPERAGTLREGLWTRWEVLRECMEDENRVRSFGSVEPLVKCIGYMHREILEKVMGIMSVGVEEEVVLGMEVVSAGGRGQVVVKDAWVFLGLLGLEVYGGVRWKGKSEEAWRLFWKVALIPIANGSNPFSRLPDSTISFELIQQVLLEDIESFFRLSATCVPLYHKCNIVLFKAVTGHLKERRKVMDEFPIGLQTKLKGGKSSIDAIRKVLRRMGRIVGGFEVLLKGEEYSHRPLIPVHNHVSDINKLQSFAAFIQTVSKSSPGIPAAANDPPTKVPLDVIAFFMFYQNKLSEIWASVEFLNKEANWPRSMFSAHLVLTVLAGSEFGRPTISLELTDTCETIGVWTRERDQLKRRYLLHQNATLQATVTTVLGSLSLITGLIFIYFLGFLYTYSADLKAVLTVKNLLLFGLQLFQIGYFASHACYISFQISRPISVIEAVFLAGWESCFIWVSWTRSHDVFHVSSSPQAIKFFQVLVIITTVVTLIPPITILIDFNPEEGELAYIGSVLANGISIFILDTYFVFCYLMYLFQRTVETVELKGYEVDAVSIFRIGLLRVTDYSHP
ncbi:hypothetical protein HDU79_003714 [Rhizoclosmatium sp. JEL0117]|nr:hypothetical protein HDU79_003714 [Rhizoclosmatium sp. JEL0117]